jgi:hypothetical protein
MCDPPPCDRDDTNLGDPLESAGKGDEGSRLVASND